jgi:hypothetical protein
LGEAASLIESLKSKALPTVDAQTQEKLDSFAMDFVFQGF